MPLPHLRIEVIDDEMATMLRLKSGAERLTIASRMFSSARRMLLNHLRSVHPEWDQRQIEQEAARRLSHGTV
jgi:Rv0078B-related antitoxin